MLQRMFLPVGQGAFYLETFLCNNEKINIIYDCGSETSPKTLEAEIESNLNKNDEILLLFISHFHDDHMNGLEYLLNNDEVKNIILPYTSEVNKHILSIKYLCSSGSKSTTSFVYRMINDPDLTIKEISENTNVHYVMPYNNRSENNSDNNIINPIKSGANVLKEINIKSPINAPITNQLYWEYIPFNFQHNKRSKQFLDNLTNNLKKEAPTYASLPLKDILKKWDNKAIQKAVKAAYNDVKGDLNTNSMTLFSGAKINDKCQKLVAHHLCKICPYDIGKANGCLYTGDYDAKGVRKWSELYNAYNEYWQYIGCIQIPHHGSHHNYNHKLALFDSYYIISAGKVNHYHHPSGSVIKDLIFEKKHLSIVTEEHYTMTTTKIEIH